jgi:hypothetical protein
MKNGVFWDVTLRSVRLLLVAAYVVPSSPILVTMMKEAPGSSETSALKKPHGVTSHKTPLFNVVPSSPTLVTLMKKALSSS